MLGFRKLALVQIKLYLRDPLNAFFTLAFGPSLFVVLGLIFGNDPDPALGGRGYLDLALPAYMAIILAVVGLAAVPISAATRREAGVLRRYSATPLRPLTYFFSDVLAPYVLSLAGAFLLFVLGTVVFHVQFSGSVPSLLVGLSLGSFAFLAFGYSLFGLVRSPRAVTLIGNVVLYAMMLLSGAMVPLEVMPEAVRRFSALSPMTHLVALLRGLWSGARWTTLSSEALILVISGILGSLVVARSFRWE
jgi:ABC-2 type transport system permease protein